MNQNALTVFLPLDAGKVPGLRDTLGQIYHDIAGNDILPFPKSKLTHFARFVILNDGPAGAPRLYFSSSFDGSRDDYLEDLVTTFGSTMEPIWSACLGYTPGCCTRPAPFRKFILDRSYPEQTFYVAFRQRTVTEILAALAAADRLQNILDKPPVPPGRKVKPPALKAAMTPPTAPSRNILTDLLGSITDGLQSLVGIRLKERSQVPLYQTSADLMAVEDQVVQNQMTVIVRVKPCFLSRLLLRAVLFAINTAGRFARGPIVGLSQIHFARWVIIDNGMNLLFESNYDGSWESYIDDFIDRASFGLNMIWGNTIEYPSGGALDAEVFKKSIRVNQFPSQVFYSAYPFATVPNIMNALAVQEAAGGPSSPASPTRAVFDSGYYPSPH